MVLAYAKISNLSMSAKVFFLPAKVRPISLFYRKTKNRKPLFNRAFIGFNNSTGIILR
jgi:hypothetical protein